MNENKKNLIDYIEMIDTFFKNNDYILDNEDKLLAFYRKYINELKEIRKGNNDEK